MTSQVDMRQDFVGGGALTGSERRDCERSWRVGGWHRTILCVALRWTWGFRNPGRTQTQVLVVSISLLACVRRHESGALGVAEHGGATLKSESTVLESLKVTEVGALGNSWRGWSNVALLSERVRAMQIVGANPGVEARRSGRLLQKLRETATLTASERNGLVLFVGWFKERRGRQERQREESSPNGRGECQRWLTKNDLVKSVDNPRQNGGPRDGGSQINSQSDHSRKDCTG